MNWTLKQEELIIEALQSGPEHQGALTDSLLDGDNKTKRLFKGKTTRSIVSKARSLTHEALVNDVLLVMPPPAPTERKPTAAEKRALLFAGMNKMTAKQKKTKTVADAIDVAREAIRKRKAAGDKAKATKLKKKHEAEASEAAALAASVKKK